MGLVCGGVAIWCVTRTNSFFGSNFEATIRHFAAFPFCTTVFFSENVKIQCTK